MTPNSKHVGVDGDGDGDDLFHRHNPVSIATTRPSIIDGAKDTRYVNHRSTFHSGSSRNREMPCAVRIGSPSSALNSACSHIAAWRPRFVAVAVADNVHA
jgi:hypothetical protein